MRTDERAEGSMREGSRQINLHECPRPMTGARKESRENGKCANWGVRKNMRLGKPATNPGSFTSSYLALGILEKPLVF